MSHDGAWAMTAIDGLSNFLLMSLIISTLTLGSLAILQKVGFQRSAAQQFHLGFATILGLLFLPVGYFCLPVVPLGWFPSTRTADNSPAFHQTAESIGVRPILELNQEPLTLPRASSDFKESVSADAGLTHPPEFIWQDSLLASPDQQPSSPPNAYSISSDTRTSSLDFASLLLQRPDRSLTVLWIAGALFLFVHFLLQLFRSWASQRRQSTNRLPPHGHTPGGVPIYLDPNASIPYVTGLIVPRIVLPTEATSWPQSQWDMTVAHEAAHLQRADLRSQALVAIACCLYWFQPLLWLLQRRMIQLREQACDDLVVSQGFSTTDYAQWLLNLACHQSGKALPATGLSMAKKPIEGRIERLLSAGISRQRFTTATRLLLFCWAILLTTGLGILRPLEPIGFAAAELPSNVTLQEDNQDDRPAENGTAPGNSPRTDIDTFHLSGRILDFQGNPVPDCEIQLFTSDHDLPLVRTDAQGQFRVEAEGLKLENGVVLVSGYARPHHQPSIQLRGVLKDSEYQFPELRLPEGRQVTGKLIVPEGGPSPINPYVQFYGSTYYSGAPIHCEADGSFRAWIPKHVYLEMLAYADNYAPSCVQVNSEIEVKLEAGTQLHGQLLRHDGKPAAGVTLCLKHRNSNHLRHVAQNTWLQQPQRIVTTDSAGRYQFPPMFGPSSLEVVAKDTWLPSGKRLRLGESDPPLLAPVPLNLSDSQPDREFNVQEVPPLKISGTIRWPDQRPAPNISLTLYSSREFVSTETSSVKTNQNGDYQILAAGDAEQIHVSVPGFGPSSLEVVAKDTWLPSGKRLRLGESDPPLLAPVPLNLSDSQPDREFNVQEVPPLKISGTIRWPDQRPAPNISLTLYSSREFVSTETSSVKTNQNGDYQILAAGDAEQIHVSVPGQMLPDGTVAEVFPTYEASIDARASGLTLTNPKTDLENVDWQFRPKKLDDHLSAKPTKSVEEQELNRICTKFLRPRTGEQVEDSEFAAAILKFEQQYRGSKAALTGLHHVLMRFTDEGEIRAEALSRVREHYLTHPFVDFCIAGTLQYDFGGTETSVEIAHHVQEHHSDPQVRAVAYRAELSYLNLKQQYFEMFQACDWKWPEQRNSAATPEQRRQFDNMVTFLQKQDIAANKKRALEIIQQLSTSYGDIIAPNYHDGVVYYATGIAAHNGDFCLERYENTEKLTFADLASRYRFQLEELQSDELAPELVSHPQPEDVRLKDHRGKIVLIYFSSPLRSDFLKQQQKLQELRDSFDGQLELIGVYDHRKTEDFLDILSDRPRPWPIVFDQDKRITHHWTYDSESTNAFLLDRNGLLRHRLTLNSDLAAIIQKWVDQP